MKKTIAILNALVVILSVSGTSFAARCPLGANPIKAAKQFNDEKSFISGILDLGLQTRDERVLIDVLSMYVDRKLNDDNYSLSDGDVISLINERLCCQNIDFRTALIERARKSDDLYVKRLVRNLSLDSDSEQDITPERRSPSHHEGLFPVGDGIFEIET